MQRINGSAHAPVGTGLLLLLGLAIVPVSLRVTGVRISFSPRLSAASDAWQQIAEVFGASYHPSPAAEFSMVRDLDIDPSTSIEPTGGLRCGDFARAQKKWEGFATAVESPDACSLKAVPGRLPAPRASRRNSLASRQVAMAVAAQAIKASFEVQVPDLEALGALKVMTLKRGDLLKGLDKRILRSTFNTIDGIGNIPDTKNMRVVVQLRKAVAGSSAKSAERKVFAALASARRRECDRAMLTGIPTDSPDHSEF